MTYPISLEHRTDSRHDAIPICSTVVKNACMLSLGTSQGTCNHSRLGTKDSKVIAVHDQAIHHEQRRSSSVDKPKGAMLPSLLCSFHRITQ